MQLKHIKRVATVTYDGTVKFDVPGDIKPHSLDFGTGVVYDEESSNATEEADVPDIPPLQIVILIVGTRGDVQPFVAIGKRLQVIYAFTFSMSFSVKFYMILCLLSLGIVDFNGNTVGDLLLATLD